MKCITLRLLLILSVVCSLTIQGQVPERRAGENLQGGTLQAPKPLRLTTSIINQRYCASNKLVLTLNLQYTNVGDRPLILFKVAKTIGRAMVSRSVKDAEAKRYAQAWDINNLVMMNYSVVDTPSPGNLFAVLNPGESLNDEDDVHVFINDGDLVNRKSLLPGDYTLEIRASTWSASPEYAEKLRARWQHYGELWTRDVKSLPMSFKIDEERPIVNCTLKIGRAALRATADGTE